MSKNWFPHLESVKANYGQDIAKRFYTMLCTIGVADNTCHDFSFYAAHSIERWRANDLASSLQIFVFLLSDSVDWQNRHTPVLWNFINIILYGLPSQFHVDLPSIRLCSLRHITCFVFLEMAALNMEMTHTVLG